MTPALTSLEVKTGEAEAASKSEADQISADLKTRSGELAEFKTHEGARRNDVSTPQGPVWKGGGVFEAQIEALLRNAWQEAEQQQAVFIDIQRSKPVLTEAGRQLPRDNREAPTAHSGNFDDAGADELGRLRERTCRSFRTRAAPPVRNGARDWRNP